MKTLTLILAASLAACATAPREPEMEVRVYSLKYADSQGVVKTVAREERERRSETLEMAADTRTNSIVVKASREVLDRLDARIRELDAR